MGRAGAAVAGEIPSRYPDALARGVLVVAGPGNNGGDGWVVARALAAAGVDVRVTSPQEDRRSPDCIAEHDLTLGVNVVQYVGDQTYSGEGLIVDAMLGTGASGPLRGPLAEARSLLELARRRGAVI